MFGLRNIWVVAVAVVMATVSTPAVVRAAQEPILVFGGTGQLGSEIVRALDAAGYPVTVFLRSSSKTDRLNGLRFDRANGDVLNAADVAAAMHIKKFAVVVDALSKGRDSDASFYEISARNIAVAAKANGVGKIIQHGSVGAGDSEPLAPADRLPPSFRPVMISKTIAESTVVKSGVTYIIIRNGMLLNGVPDAAEHAKLFDDHTKNGAVTRAGLARLTVECIGGRTCDNRIFHAVDDTLVMPPDRQVLLPAAK